MGIEASWGFAVGSLPHGPRNLISDVPGVTVGHCTLADGEVQTGVTALLPHPGDLFHEKVPAAAHVINGFGKTTGLVQIQELGTLETPILFTNTLSVGTVYDALVRHMLALCPDICETTGSVNPVVCECNDSGLDDIRGLHVTGEHVRAALAGCRAGFAEGAVGAGRGMRCHGLKGGIGSASRRLELDGRAYHLGALVLSNHARFDDLILAGVPIRERLAAASVPPHQDRGSIITVLATDAPLTCRQLGRVARRAIVGLLLLRQRQRGDRHRLFHRVPHPPLPSGGRCSPAGHPRGPDRPVFPGRGRMRGGERPLLAAARRDRHRPGRADRPQPGRPAA